MPIDDLTPENEQLVTYDKNQQLDSFGRLRTSAPNNLFEYTFVYDIDIPNYWALDTVSGGTTSHDDTATKYDLDITTTTGSKAVIQSRRRMQYFAGASHLFYFTANPNGVQSGVRKRLGLFDDNNGVFFEVDGLVPYVVIRSDTSGSVVDTRIPITSWSGDQLDGNGPSGFTAGDFTSQVLFAIDMAWLGSGGCRFGFNYDGNFHTLHHETFSAKTDGPFCKSPVLPFRVELEATGSPASADSVSISCCAYELEGVRGPIGKVRSWYQGNTAVTISGEEVLYIGRINPDYLYASSKFEDVNLMIESGNDEVVVRVYQNPTTTSGGITWNDEPSSIMQTANNPNNESINTSTGFVFESDVLRTGGRLNLNETDLFFGFEEDGTPDIFVITADSLNGSADVVLNIKTREFY